MFGFFIFLKLIIKLIVVFCGDEFKDEFIFVFCLGFFNFRVCLERDYGVF